MNKEALLDAITEAQNQYINHDNIQKIFDGLLIQLLKLTNSDYGYIGEVLHTPDGAPFLRTHAISNIAWNEETRAFYEANAPTGLEFYNLDTLFGYVLRHNTVVISNNPAEDKRAGGLPEGHPPLNSYLGLPFISADHLIGSAGISNRPGGYNEEVVNFLHPFIAACSNILLANRAKQDLNRNERLRNEIISVVSHELRTPVTSIHGSLGLLERMHKDEMPPKVAKLIDIASRSSKRMLRLLDDILDVQKLETGDLEIQLNECELREIIKSVLDEFEPTATQQNITLRMDAPTTVKLTADKDRISQIVVNLVSNAIKHSDKGEVVVSLRDQGDQITLSCKDDGKGIPDNALGTIFDKFHQVEDSSTRSQSGVGLGLYLVKRLVEKHGGTIRVDSELHKGSCFSIEFYKSWTGKGTPSQSSA